MLSNRYLRVAAATLGVLVLLAVAMAYFLRSQQPTIADKSLSSGGETRRYRVAAPIVEPARKVPLVFAFHGAGSTSQAMASGSEWDAVAAQHDLVVVYPQGIHNFWPVPPASSPEQLARDLTFFDRMLQQCLESYPIDPDRIYLIGMSQGASFAQHLAQRRSEQIAAVAAHSHAPPTSIWGNEPARHVPIMLLVGDADRQANTAMVVQADEKYRQRGHETELVVLSDWGHRWDVDQNEAIVRFLLSHELTE